MYGCMSSVVVFLDLQKLLDKPVQRVMFFTPPAPLKAYPSPSIIQTVTRGELSTRRAKGKIKTHTFLGV